MSDEKRGLASADEETRENVARKGGEARAQDRESLSEAGRKGGEKVAQEKGPEFYSEIGKKGG
jgi:general stress protein YciG